MHDDELENLEKAKILDPSNIETSWKYSQALLRRGLGKNVIYIIVSKSYDYNDEYYYDSVAGGGSPIEAYVSKEKAENEAKLRSIKEFMSLDRLWEWGGGEGALGIFMSTSAEDLVNLFEKVGVAARAEDFNDADRLEEIYKDLRKQYTEQKITAEQIIPIYDASSLQFFYVEEIPVEDGSCA